MDQAGYDLATTWLRLSVTKFDLLSDEIAPENGISLSAASPGTKSGGSVTSLGVGYGFAKQLLGWTEQFFNTT